MTTTIKFARTKAEYFTTLNQRVNAYFTSNNIQKTANSEMVIKTIFMLALYMTPYFIMITGFVTAGWALQVFVW